MKKKTIVVLLILFFILIGTALLFLPRGEQEIARKPEPKATAKKVSKKANATDESVKKPAGLQQYDKKILYYSTPDGKVKGTAGIVYEFNELSVTFNFYFVENFSREKRYVGKLLIDGSTGSLSSALVSAGWEDKPKINNPFSVYWTDVYKNRGYRGDLDAFYLSIKYRTKSAQSILDAKELLIYQSSNSAEFDLSKIVNGGTKIRAYKLQVKETTLDKLKDEIKTTK